MEKMPGVSSTRNSRQPPLHITHYHHSITDTRRRRHSTNYFTSKRQLRSPITSLLASLSHRRGHLLFPTSPPPPPSSSSSSQMRQRMSTKLQEPFSPPSSTSSTSTPPGSPLTEIDLEPVFRMATDWAEVIFFHHGSQVFDPLSVQGSWRKDTLGVSITPDWQPPSPISGCVTNVTRNPRTLLQTPLMRLPCHDPSDSQGDDTEESEDELDIEGEGEDENDKEYCPTPLSSNRSSSSHVTPTTSRPPPSPSLNKTLSLFTPSSPLSSCNIKSLLSSTKFKLLPKSIQSKLTRHLPSSDQLISKHLNNSSTTNTANTNLDSILNNEYISASLREWQERLLIGNLHRKRSRHNETTPQWKELFYEDYWGQNKKQCLSNNNTQLYYSSTSNYTPKQTLIHNTIFETQSNTSLLTATQNGSCALQTTPSCDPLPVQLPLQAYAVHCTSQQIMQEHSYCSTKGLHNTLTLIVGSKCSCHTAPLRVCQTCHCLYHPLCGTVPKCPACK